MANYGPVNGGFLNDYSNISAAGSAFQGFAQGLKDSQDMQMKKQEFDAKVAAQKALLDRESMQKALDLRKAGYQQDDQGNISEAPLTARQQGAQKLDAFKAGGKITTDENGNITGVEYDPSTLKAKQAEAQILANSSRGRAMMDRNDIQRDNQSYQASKNIHNDGALKQMRQQSTNIDKGLDLLNGQPSYKALNEVAQDFSAALSGRAVSSDFKLKELATPTLKQKIADLAAYATSNPNQPADPKVVEFWRSMGSRLSEAYDRQMSARAHGLLKGSKRAFAHNPNAQAAMQDAADLYSTGNWRSAGIDDDGSSQASSGLVNTGLVNTGLVRTGQGQSSSHPQDAEAINWAKSHPDDLRAAKILKANGF